MLVCSECGERMPRVGMTVVMCQCRDALQREHSNRERSRTWQREVQTALQKRAKQRRARRRNNQE